MKTIDPDLQALPAILAGLPQDTPIVMLNLLRFRDTALYKGVPADYSGREAYRRYSEVALQQLAKIGAAVLYLGDVKGALIAPPDEAWDEVLLVRYPSIQAFMGMLADADYRASTKHRTAALDDARLIATVAHPR
ncbi:MAG: hypothetical protein K0S46_2427 [Moraxellaceae bacterium]|jgi:uncharacterized protein (DUF1330 family)|nr:hypothetical protein [Moraxellaceae bacterium]